MGRIQVRDWLIGSSSAISPTYLLIGMGAVTWSGNITTLSNQTGSYLITTFGGDTNQLGSFTVIIPSYQYPGVVSMAEIGISGGKLFIYDSTGNTTLGTAGSELRVTSIFKIGS